MSTQVPRYAGLGVFIINNQSAIYIKAMLRNSSSVLMAEVAALAVGAKIISALGIQHPFFLSDNQQVVNFFNGNHHDNPPQWKIKPFTQCFINNTSNNNARIFQIHRKLNITAHVLATEAFSCTNRTNFDLTSSCTNPGHVNSCPYSFELCNQ